MNTLASLRLTR